jgi:hypothetical protein
MKSEVERERRTSRSAYKPRCLESGFFAYFPSLSLPHTLAYARALVGREHTHGRASAHARTHARTHACTHPPTHTLTLSPVDVFNGAGESRGRGVVREGERERNEKKKKKKKKSNYGPAAYIKSEITARMMH